MLRLSVLAVAALAACTSPAPDTQTRPNIITQELPYRAGTGTVQSVKEMPSGGYRLAIRMSNGTMQYVDTDSREMMAGSRVELTPGREIRKL